MKSLLTVLFCLCVLMGCGESKEEKAAKAKVATEAKAAAWISDSNDPNNVTIEAEIRRVLEKSTCELTQADLEKVKMLDLDFNKLTNVKGLKKLTQLEYLDLNSNKLTDVKGLEKLTKLTLLFLTNNPNLIKSQIAELQKALPKCKIFSYATK